MEGFSRAELTRHFYKWVLFSSLAQFALGPLLLLTLPGKFLSGSLLSLLGVALLAACVALYLLIQEAFGSADLIGRRYWTIVACLSVTVLGMGYGRHEIRETALAPHKEAVDWRTREFHSIEVGPR